MSYLKIYFIAFIIFLIIDVVWIGLVAKNFYASNLGHLMAKNFNLWAALIFYVIYIFAIVYFVVIPAVDAQSFNVALINGFILGLVCYSTYDLTNYATLENFPLKVVVVDMIWGSFLTTSISVITYYFVK